MCPADAVKVKKPIQKMALSLMNDDIPDSDESDVIADQGMEDTDSDNILVIMKH
jgi:hypothetical protein